MSSVMNGVSVLGRIHVGSAAPPAGYFSLKGTARTVGSSPVNLSMKFDTPGLWTLGPPPLIVTMSGTLLITNNGLWQFTNNIYIVCSQAQYTAITNSLVGVIAFNSWNDLTAHTTSTINFNDGFGVDKRIDLNNYSNSFRIGIFNSVSSGFHGIPF